MSLWQCSLSVAKAASLDSGVTAAKFSLTKQAILVLDVRLSNIKIESGPSEIDKRIALQSKSLTIPSFISKGGLLSLDELRVLYQEAAAKYCIDWRLVEAVHQVESGKSTSTCKRSYAGATGPMQFMPGTFRKYSEGGSICDLRSSVFAAANLLSQNGAGSGNIDSALYSYNHSLTYVAKVKRVMESI